MQTLRHIVFGTDFSECAEQAIEVAITLAAATAARLTLVHVCELGVDDMDDRRLAQCDEALSRAVAIYRARRVDVTGVLRSGKPWMKLDNVAAEVGASLIVVGRHGVSGNQRIALGSVADQLVRVASRPVLTVPCDFDRLNSEVDEPNTPTESTTHHEEPQHR